MAPIRTRLLQQLAAEIEAIEEPRIVRVGIDGVDGAGKTWLADELAETIVSRPTIRASVDSFHNPRAVRYANGRNSPEGFYADSFNYQKMKRVLLEPLSPGGSGRYRAAAFDHLTDQPVTAPVQTALAGSVLIVDGIFLHRHELRGFWDYSVFLEVSSACSVKRCIERAGVSGVPDNPDDPVHARYVLGQRLYLRQCEPAVHATHVVNNENLAAPGFVS